MRLFGMVDLVMFGYVCRCISDPNYRAWYVLLMFQVTHLKIVFQNHNVWYCFMTLNRNGEWQVINLNIYWNLIILSNILRKSQTDGGTRLQWVDNDSAVFQCVPHRKAAPYWRKIYWGLEILGFNISIHFSRLHYILATLPILHWYVPVVSRICFADFSCPFCTEFGFITNLLKFWSLNAISVICVYAWIVS